MTNSFGEYPTVIPWLMIYAPSMVALAGVCLAFAIFLGFLPLKLLAPLVCYSIVIVSISILIRFSRYLSGTVLLSIVIISGVPLLRIVADSVAAWSPKMISDAFFVLMPYYYIPLIGCAFAIVSTERRGLLQLNLRKVAIFGYLPTCAYAAYIIRSGQINEAFGSIYAVIANVFVPLAVLTVSRYDKRLRAIGWISIATITGISALMGSRSYLVVSAIALVFALMLSGSTGKSASFGLKALGRSLVLLAIVVVAAITLPTNFGSDLAVVEKLRIAELLDAINGAFAEGDAGRMFYWSGNSRSMIIQDAFFDFDSSEWMFGRGIFGTYRSFIERHTLEVGWLQEVFNWGIPYVCVVIGISIAALIKLARRQGDGDGTENLYMMTIVLKLADGWIYGMPEFTLYNFLYFAAIYAAFMPQTSAVKASAQRRRLASDWGHAHPVAHETQRET